jgi:predicted nucleic acid-binding protein
MTVETVLDTNILVYAVSSLEADSVKTARAQELVKQPFGVSGQILQEFYVNVTRKIKTPLTPSAALEWVEQLELQPFVPIDAALIKTGIAIAERYQISYWDAAIIAAAVALGATALYTEDLSHGQIYGSVRVVNPFLAQ